MQVGSSHSRVPSAYAPARPVSPRTLWLVMAGIFLLAAFPFRSAIHAGFFNLDDPGFLLEVDGWRGLGPDNLAWMFSTMHLGHYQPLTYLSYAIEYSIAGLDPRVFHATNIALHAISAVLVFRLVMAILGLARSANAAGVAAAAQPPIASPRAPHLTDALVALLAALAWGVHPLRVEAVAWITERRDVLSTALLLGAAIAYVRACAPARAELASRSWYVACCGLLLASLLSKAWGITFIAVVLVLDVWPLGRLPWPPWQWLATRERRIVLIHKLPIAGLCVLFAVLAAMAQTRASDETVRTLAEWTITDRIAQGSYGLVFYALKTPWPSNLSILYELPRAIDWSQPRWGLSIACVLAAAGLVFWLRHRAPGVAAALVLYAVLVSPVLGVFQSGIQLVADRYAYVATIPLCALAGYGIVRLLQHVCPRAIASASERRGNVLHLGLVILCMAIPLIFLRGAAAHRTDMWASPTALWEQALAAGHEGPVLRNYYGRQLEHIGKHDKAVEQYARSLELNPTYADSWLGMGTSLRALGRHAAAEQPFIMAARHAQDPTRAHLALGLLYLTQLNRPDDAIASLRASVAALEASGNRARTGVPYLNLAVAYGMTDRLREAKAMLDKAAEFEDTKAKAQELLANLASEGIR